jgi:hypothetical protein
MRTFSFFTRDALRPVRSHMYALLGDEGRAREFARRRLDSSPHHLSVEVREAGRVLFSVLRSEPKPGSIPAARA